MAEAATALQIQSALSEAEETGKAIDHVLHVLTQTLSSPVDLAMVFATAHHADAFDLIHRHLTNGLKPRTVLGTTAEGVIGKGREVESDRPGLSVLAATLPGTTVKPFHYEQIDWATLIESPDALRDQIDVRDLDIRAIVMLADPFSTPLVKLLPTFAETFGAVPLVGGMASAASKPGENRLLIDGRILQSGAVGVSISGPIRVDCTVSQGCRPIGRPFVITQSQRHVVQQIGGRSALEVLQELLEELDAEDRHLVQTKGLLVGRVIDEYKERFGRGDFLIKNIIGIDQDSGYIALGDPQTRVGQTIQFHVRDQKTAQEDFMLLLEGQQLHGSAEGALLFSCNGRGSNLFDEPNVDALMIQQAMGEVPLAGFFAAGEIGPVGDQSFLHGHTASLIVFRSELESKGEEA